jgi:lipopolysaccharide biosynthesis glycosyltransferase
VGVNAVGSSKTPEVTRRSIERLGLPDMEQYVNSWVLLMNLKQIRADSLMACFAELTAVGFASEDQDVLNVSYYGKITLLPIRFNVMTSYNLSSEEAFYDSEAKRRFFPPPQYTNALLYPVVIHYGRRKSLGTPLMLTCVSCGGTMRGKALFGARLNLLPKNLLKPKKGSEKNGTSAKTTGADCAK